jgi:hypothetical protein
MPVDGLDSPEIIKDPAKQLLIWQARFGAASPKEVCSTLLGDFARLPGQSATLYLSDEGVYEGDPHPITLVTRKGLLRAQFNLQVMEPLDRAQEAYFADAYVDAPTGKGEGRGTGMGGQITLQIINTLKRFPSMDRLLIHAEQTGSYAWAKMGFDINHDAWCHNKRVIRERLEAVKDQLAGQPRVYDLLHRALLQNADTVPGILKGLRAKTDFGVDPYHTDRPLDLGKYLFRNLPWEGAFDLRSEAAYAALSQHASSYRAGRG